MEENQTQNPMPQTAEQPAEMQEAPAQETEEYGPRRLTFLSLVLKTLAGFGGGMAGTGVLLIIFLATSSVLNSVLGTGADPSQANPLAMVIIVAMIFATSLVSSLLGTLFLSYTERERYTRISTTMGQVFILNLVIFLFVLPIYLTTSLTNLEVLAFSAGLQAILSAMASALILELMVDYKYSLLAVYSTILAVLVGAGMSFIFYNLIGNSTVLMFIALPLLWSLIGFFQTTVGMFYYWVFQTWGTDYLAAENSLGTDYGIPDTTEEELEEEAEAEGEDVEGSDFLNKA